MVRNLTTRKSSTKAAALAVLFSMLIVATMVTLVSANSMIPQARMQGNEGETLQGEIVGIYNLHTLEMVTLRGEELGNFPTDKVNVFVNKSTKIEVCNAPEPFKDINMNRDATVTYHEVGAGLAVADRISEQC